MLVEHIFCHIQRNDFLFRTEMVVSIRTGPSQSSSYSPPRPGANFSSYCSIVEIKLNIYQKYIGVVSTSSMIVDFIINRILSYVHMYYLLNKTRLKCTVLPSSRIFLCLKFYTFIGKVFSLVFSRAVFRKRRRLLLSPRLSTSIPL